jgi:hypothetical protein
VASGYEERLSVDQVARDNSAKLADWRDKCLKSAANNRLCLEGVLDGYPRYRVQACGG